MEVCGEYDMEEAMVTRRKAPEGVKVHMKSQACCSPGSHNLKLLRIAGRKKKKGRRNRYKGELGRMRFAHFS